MDVSVEIGEGLGAVTVPAPAISSNSAGDAARTELSKILSDTTHPHHLGLKRGDSVANGYVDNLYKRAYSNSNAVDHAQLPVVGSLPSQPGEIQEQAGDQARNEVILAPLRQEWAGDYDARYMRAVGSARTLFGGEGWGEIFEDLGTTIRREYGPAGETAALRFLDALANIRQRYGGN